MTFFVIRRHVLEDILADARWRRKLDEAKTGRQCEEVIVEYCKKKKIKVAHIRNPL